jgi:hypothetical protein
LSFGCVPSIEKLDEHEAALALQEHGKLSGCEKVLLQLGFEGGTWCVAITPDGSSSSSSSTTSEGSNQEQQLSVTRALLC